MSGAEMMQAFVYVRDVYANVSRMLQSADPVMSERGYSPYAWEAIWRSRLKVGNFDEWMPTFVIRQYHGPEGKDREIVTVGAALWSWPSESEQRRLLEPLCIVSRMYVSDAPDDVYRFGVVQRWTKTATADGEVRVIGSKDVAFAEAERTLFEKIVVGARLVSAAHPLTSITSTEQLETSLIKPVLAQPMPWLPK
jgi:hypothetical protein